MKAKILKIAGVKSEAAFYKKFPNQKAFMKVHGKEFKKAQSGMNLDNNNNGVADYFENPVNPSAIGQTGNWSGTQGYQSAQNYYGDNLTGFQSGFNQPFGKPQTNAEFENPYIQGTPYQGPSQADIASRANQNIGMPSTPAGSNKKTNQPDIGNITGMIGGAKDAYEGIQAEKDLTEKLTAWANVSDVRKRAEISNVFAAKPEHQWFSPADPRNIQDASSMYNPIGRGTDVRAAQNGSAIGGNPTEIQNTYGDGNSIYDDLGYDYNDNIKAYQSGGGFGASGWNQLTDSLGGDSSKGFAGNIGQTSPMGSLGSTVFNNQGAAFGEKIGSFAGPLGQLAGGFIGGYLDKEPGKQDFQQSRLNANDAFSNNLNAANYFNNKFSATTQNGGELQPYEDGGWVSNDWTPQVIASFGGLDEQEVYDYAHDGMDTLRAGGHLRSYTPPSDRAMETYAMGGQLKTHGVGEIETLSRNPYMPGSGEMGILRGPSHNNGGIDISYGNAQNGYTNAQNGSGDSKVNAEGGETMFEMQDGGQVNPQTGDPSLSAVVLGNLPLNLKAVEATGDEVLIGLAKKYPNNTMKFIGEKIAKDDNKAAKYKDIASNLSNKADKTKIGMLDESTAKAMDLASKLTYKESADERMKLANWQTSINEVKDEHSVAAGKNLSAEAMAKGYNEIDLDPVTKDAPLKRVAQNGDYISKYDITPWQGNIAKGNKYGKTSASGFSAKQWDEVADKLGFKGKGNKEFEEFLLSDPRSAPLIKSRHQNLYGKDPWIDPEHFGGGWAANELLLPNAAEIPADTTIKTIPESKDTRVLPYKGNKFGQFLGMVSPLFQNDRLPGIDPRQFAKEYMSIAQNQQEAVPLQQTQVELDPLTRMSYQDIRNQNTADFRDVERNIGYNPAVMSGLLGKKYAANQPAYAEEFRTNQALEDKTYGGNRAKVFQNQITNLGSKAEQMKNQSIAASNTKETQQAAIASMADKYMQHDARNQEYKIRRNLFPTYAYSPSGRIHTQGPGFTPNIPQIYGDKGGLKQVPVYKADGKTIDHYQMEEDAPGEYTALGKNGASITDKKNKKSVVKNAKNGSIVRSLKNL